jgi:type II restriction/modification system DNA methylase subunit YeeA
LVKKNYSIEKRQKDIAKKKKQEEKRQKKLNKGASGEGEVASEDVTSETQEGSTPNPEST